MQPVRRTWLVDLWWLLGAAALGGCCSVVVPYLLPAARAAERLWYAVAGLLLAGFVAGLARPAASWRWGIAAALPAIVHASIQLLDPGRAPLGAALVISFVLSVLLAPFFTPPSLLGAHLASCLRAGCEAFLPRALFHGSRGPAVSWGVGILGWPCLWSAVLGTVGLVVGFAGPDLVGSQANQRALIGILVTGPVGAIGGAILGLVMALLRRWQWPEMILALLVVANFYLGLIISTF